jgi:hypothetical protein
MRLHAQIVPPGAPLFAKVGGYYLELEVIVKVEYTDGHVVGQIKQANQIELQEFSVIW